MCFLGSQSCICSLEALCLISCVFLKFLGYFYEIYDFSFNNHGAISPTYSIFQGGNGYTTKFLTKIMMCIVKKPSFSVDCLCGWCKGQGQGGGGRDGRDGSGIEGLGWIQVQRKMSSNLLCHCLPYFLETGSLSLELC